MLGKRGVRKQVVGARDGEPKWLAFTTSFYLIEMQSKASRTMPCVNDAETSFGNLF